MCSPLSNVVRLERVSIYWADIWSASIGDDDGGITVIGATPVESLLGLAAKLREVTWEFAEAKRPSIQLPQSPNVIVLSCSGPADWRRWYATGWAPPPDDRSVNACSPLGALRAFANQIRQWSYALDADFRFAAGT